MNEDIRLYGRIGLVHHMLYPRCLEDPDDHVDTLKAFVQRDDIETFDCCLPYGEERRKALISAIRHSGKQAITFATHLFPLRKFPFSSYLPQEQAQIRMIMADMVDQAVDIGATGFIFASGGPTPTEATAAHYDAFADFSLWLCQELEPYGITVMLEPFDTTVDKKYLYGPTRACVELVESIRAKASNLGIELDVAHVPLMGEPFDQAIRTVAPYLERVHLGNCILKDSSHPRYGDTHPPVGFPGGEVDTPELTQILRCLLDVGYLSKERRGNLVLEMTPWPGWAVDQTVADSLDRLAAAWCEV